MKLAAYEGHLPVVEWLHTMGCTADNFRGRTHPQNWVPTENATFPNTVCAKAARGGHLNVLKWLHSEGFPLDGGSCIEAVFSGDVEIFEWLSSKKCDPGYYSDQLMVAMGNIQLLEWLSAKYNIFSDHDRIILIVCGACAAGQIRVLDWVYSNDRFDDSYCQYADPTDIAGHNGHTETLEWLRHHGFPVIHAIAAANGNGKTETVKWLTANGFPADIAPYPGIRSCWDITSGDYVMNMFPATSRMFDLIYF